MVYWTKRKLETHYQEHPAGKDKACWMDLLTKTLQVSQSEYESVSITVTQSAWLQYRAEEADVRSYYDAVANPGNPPYHDEARYYTDVRLIRTVTNTNNDEIRTCYHEHFGRKHQPGSGSLAPKAKGDAMIKYLRELRNRRQSKMLRNMKIEAVCDALPPPIHLIVEELKALVTSE